MKPRAAWRCSRCMLADSSNPSIALPEKMRPTAGLNTAPKHAASEKRLWSFIVGKPVVEDAAEPHR